MSMRSRLARLASVVAVAGALTAGALAVGAAPASAAGLNDLVIKNGGVLSFTVCKAATSPTTCGGPTGTLNQGQNTKTKFGWADADLVKAPAGCRVEQLGPTGSWTNLGSGPGWIKLSGFYGITETVRVTCG